MKYTEISYWNKVRAQSLKLRRRPGVSSPPLTSRLAACRTKQPKVPLYSIGPGGIRNYTQREFFEDEAV